MKVSRYEGMIHGFFGMPFDKSKQAIEEAATALKEAFASQSAANR